jgi:transposase-like protein
MSRRKFSVEEKLAILKETETNGITPTIRRHGIYAEMAAAARSIAGGGSWRSGAGRGSNLTNALIPSCGAFS